MLDRSCRPAISIHDRLDHFVHLGMTISDHSPPAAYPILPIEQLSASHPSAIHRWPATADPGGGIRMIDMHRHFTQQQRKRIDQDRHWLSQNRDEVMKLLRARDGDICLWCNKPNEDYEIIAATDQCQKLRPVELAIDHIVPASSGDETDIDNLCLLHKECNLEKGHLLSRSFQERVRQYRAAREGEDDDDRWMYEWLRIWRY